MLGLWSHSYVKNSKGQNLVEFALVLPILLLIVFAVVDLGRMTYNKILLNQIAKETLRAVSVGSSMTSVTDRVQSLSEPIIGSNITVSISSSSYDDQGKLCTRVTVNPSSGRSIQVFITPVYSSSLTTGSNIRVAVTYTMGYITPVFTMFSQQVEMKSSYFTRLEVPPA